MALYIYILTEHDPFGLVSSIHFSFDLGPKVSVPILSLPHLLRAVEPSEEKYFRKIY